MAYVNTKLNILKTYYIVTKIIQEKTNFIHLNPLSAIDAYIRLCSFKINNSSYQHLTDKSLS